MRCILFGVLVLAVTAQASHVQGVEVRGDEQFTLPAEETVDDNLYVFGRQVTIDGTVNGDLIVFAEQITVNGTVNGDLIAAGQTVVLAGSVEDARIAGYVLKLAKGAKVDGDLSAAGFSLECEKGSSITGDVLYAGYQALLAGTIDNDVHAGLVSCLLAGTIGGDADLHVEGKPGEQPPPNFGPPPPVPFPSVPGGLTVADTAEVQGKLTYAAPQEASIDPQARLTGEVEHQRPAPHADPAAPAEKRWTSFALDRLRHAVCVAIVGLVALLLVPQWSRTWADNVRTRPGASFLGGVLGVLAFIVLLVVLVVVIVAAAILLGLTTLNELIPLVIIGGMVGYVAMIVGFWLLAAYLGEAIAALALGRTAVRSEASVAYLGAMLLGLLIVALLLSIPYVGAWIGLLVFLFGFGGFCLWLIGMTPLTPETSTAEPARLATAKS